MRHVPPIAEFAALAHSEDLAATGPLYPLPLIYVSCSPAEMRQAACPCRVSVLAHGSAYAVDRAKQPLELLRLRSYGCSPPTRQAVPLPREHRMPAPPVGTSGGPRLARVGSQSRFPNACLP